VGGVYKDSPGGKYFTHNFLVFFREKHWEFPEKTGRATKFFLVETEISPGLLWGVYYFLETPKLDFLDFFMHWHFYRFFCTLEQPRIFGSKFMKKPYRSCVALIYGAHCTFYFST